MKKVITNLVLIIYSILILIMIIFGLLSGIKNDLLLLIISIFSLIVIYYLNKKFNLIKKIINNKKTIIILIILGIVLRLLLLFLNYSEVYSDEATFYNNAVSLSAKGGLNNKYIALFPYLYSYITLLGNFMKLTSINFKMVVILNIILDLCGSLFAYLTGKNLKNKQYGLLLMLMWLFNPFQILYCMKALPIIIVNVLFIISLYVFSLLNKQNKILYITIFSILLGITLGISNSFRPIFVILVIAIFLYYLYEIIINKSNYKNKILSFILIALCFFGINKIYTNIVSSKTEYSISGSSGWTLYVGSNLESSGAWFYSEEFNKFVESDNFDTKNIHDYFQEKALLNYKSYSILETGLLFTKKYYILTSNLSHYTYENTISNFLIKIIMYIYWFFLITSNIFKIKRKKDQPDWLLFVIIIEIGLILSHLLVEVSPRYFTPCLVPLLLISAYHLNNSIKKSTT